jgi:methionyl-tRNA formyltransferase
VRVVFFGTGDFAVSALEAIREHVILVVTQPDRPSGRGMKLHVSPMKSRAVELGLEVASPEKARDESFVEQLEAMKPDMLLVASYGQILSSRLLNTAQRGGINLHGSILPKYRGAAPIQRAVLNGEKETGITLMQMDKGMDTGDIIEIVRTSIDPDETYGELQVRLGEVAAEMAKAWLPRLAAGDYERKPQDNSIATLAPKITKDEAELNLTKPANLEYDRYRAFTPAPGAFLSTRFGKIRVSRAALSDTNADPGTVLSPNLVAFKEGSFELIEIQPEGKKRMSGRDFLNGARLRTGDNLLNERSE